MYFEKLKDEINTLIIEDMGVDNFDDNSVLYGNICVDSMDMVEFIMDIEGKFDIHLNSEDEESMHNEDFTIGKLYSLVEKRIIENLESEEYS